MLKLQIYKPTVSPYRILCLGAHSDDIEIGCGGTILSLLEYNPAAEFFWVVFSADQQRADEAWNSANSFLREAQSKYIVIKDFRGSFFPYIGATIKDYFEQLKRDYIPDLIFTHYRNDLHQDHRLISELTWNTFRSHLILEYEIPKYDGDLGTPNCFVPLDKTTCSKKIQYIIENFQSQHYKDWFDQETFLSILKIRGIECNAPSKYAEAFYCRKITLSLTVQTTSDSPPDTPVSL